MDHLRQYDGAIMIIWVIYKHKQYTAQQYLDGEPGKIQLHADSLKKLHGKLPPNMIKLPRNPFDNPGIIESWI